MKILIDIGHPAHVHYFRNFIKIMEKNGNKIYVTARNRYPVQPLLTHYKIKYFNRGKGANSFIGKLIYLIIIDIYLVIISCYIRPDIYISFGAVYLTHVAKFFNKKSIFIDDTDNARLNQKFYVPFATTILTPDIFKHDFGSKHIRFKSYMELAYLHPNYFKNTEDISNILPIDKNEKYIIIRFVSWTANHDYGHAGMSLKNKIRAVKEFSKYSKVFISSESILPNELEKYKIAISPEHMHIVLANCSLLFGESATMASECAVLGVPSIYIDNDGRCYTDEEESKYGIVYNFKENQDEQIKAIVKGVELLQSKIDFREKRKKILEDKISFTDFLVWFVSNYPHSCNVMKSNPEFQNRFK